ncbi:hypothetical protein JM658_16940, partial [Joostella atrarenae]
MPRPKQKEPRSKLVSIRFTEYEYKNLYTIFNEQKAYGFRSFNAFLRNKLFFNNDELVRQLRTRKSEKQVIIEERMIFQLKKAGTNLNTLIRFVYRDQTTTKLSLKDLVTIRDVIISFKSIIKKLENDS